MMETIKSILMENKLYVIWLLINSLLSTVSITSASVLPGVTINYLVDKKITLAIICVILLALIGYGSSLVSYYVNGITRKEMNRIAKEVNSKIMGALASLPLSSYEETDTYYDIALIAQQTDKCYVNIIEEIPNICSLILQIISYSTVILILDSKMMILLVVNVLTGYITNKKITKYEDQYVRKATEVNRKNSYISFIFQNRYFAADIRSYDCFSNFLIRKYRNENKKIDDLIQDVIKKEKNPYFIRFGIERLVGGILDVFLIVSIIKGNMNVGDFIIIRTGISQLGSCLTNLLSISPSLSIDVSYIDKYYKFIDECSEMEKQENNKYGGVVDRAIIDNLCFSYPGSSQDTIKNFNFEGNCGKMNVIIGKNGSGKSTLAKLISGMYSPTSGTIQFIANQDNLILSPDDLRIGYLQQNAQTYSLSIRENIVMSDKKIISEDEDIKKIIKELGLSRKLTEIDKTLDSQLTKEFDPDGTYLSGGEMQKITLARILANHYNVIIADEPTSNLDEETTKKFIQMLRELSKRKIVFLITHNLNYIENTDKIIELV